MILINKKDTPVYSGDREGKILYLETWGESTALMIVSFGSHPCSYITFPGIEHMSNYDEANDFFMQVHGGFTFLGTRESLGIEGIWLGWDYAHAGDLLYSERIDFSIPGDHKWELDDLILQARDTLFTVLLERS